MRLRITTKSNTGRAKRDIARCPNHVIVTSPYLTSEVAEVVIGGCDASTAIVLTRFDASTFAGGGSSLATIGNLIGMGYSVRALDGLHAKLVVTGETAMVGSQNLTAGGTRNLEATACISGPAHVARLRSELAVWVRASTPITPDHVRDMEGEVAKLRQLAEDFRRACAASDVAVWAVDERRREAAERAERHRREAGRAKGRRAGASRVAKALRKAMESAPAIDSVSLRLEWKPHLLDGKPRGIATRP